MGKPTMKPYSFKRVSHVTQFLYGDTLVMNITNMTDNVAEAITLQLNIAFENGHEMTLKSIEKNLKPSTFKQTIKEKVEEWKDSLSDEEWVELFKKVVLKKHDIDINEDIQNNNHK